MFERLIHPFLPSKRGVCLYPVPVEDYYIPCGKMRALHAVDDDLPEVGVTKTVRRVGALLSALMLTLLIALPALAADPPVLTGTTIDETGKLDGGASRIEAAAKTLKDERGITLYVVFINQLDGEDPAAFIERVAAANNLTDGKNALMLVSLNDRKDAVYASRQTDISTDELTTIRTQSVEPKLKSGDFVGAVEAAAVGFKNADAGTAPVPPVTPAQPATPSAPSVKIDWAPVGQLLLFTIGLVAALVIIGGVLSFAATRLRAKRALDEQKATMERWARDAHVATLKGDEDIRTAVSELAYAEAQYGADEVKPLRAALSEAQETMSEVFKVGKLIEDEDPDTYEERKEMFERIVSLTSSVEAVVARQEKALTKLHDLEATAADTVRQMKSLAKSRTANVKKAEDIIARLQQHGQSALPSVDQNVKVAAAINKAADTSLDSIQELLDAGKTPQAVPLIRQTQQELARGQTSLDAVFKVGRSLDEAERTLDAELASAAAEIAKADNAASRTDLRGLTGNLSAARRTLASAHTVMESAKPDYLEAHRLAVEANGMADEVLDSIRSEEERKRRAVEQAEALIRQAAASIAQADSYIASHGSTVGRRARTKLEDARTRYTASTVSGGDIFAAAVIAQQAQESADSAYTIARSDVSSASASSYGYGSSSSSGGSYGSSSSGSYSSSHDDDSFSIGSFGGGGSSGGSFGGGGGGGGSSGGGW